MPQKGTVLVHNGEKLVGIEPQGNGKVIVFDSTTNSGIRWKDSSKKSDKIIMNTKDSSNDATYTKMAEFFFSKEEYDSIETVKILSYMDKNISNYQVRLYDTSNNKVIFETTLNNIRPQITTIREFDYQPVNDTILEVQVKTNKLINRKKYYVYLIDATINYSF